MKKFQSMLALAAVAIIAVACGSKTETTTTPATDTGVAADTAAADTGTGSDATATTDANATADTVATADTGMAADMAMGTDTTATAAAGGCMGASDKAFQGGLADATKGAAFAGDVKTCTLAKGCLGKATDTDKIKCISDCIAGLHKAEGLTDSCSACYGLTGWCGAGPCLASCAVDPSSEGCKTCIGTNCDPAANACKAGTCDPYGATHCKP